MEPLKEFKLKFDRGMEVYHPRDVVGGHVVVYFTKPINITGIYVRFEGAVYVNLERSMNDNPNSEGGHKSVLFASMFDLLGNGNPEETLCHPAGYRELPFCYPLPTDLPSSFEGEYGYVRYTCHALIRGGDLQDTPLAMMGVFTVHREYDLNSESRTLSRADQQEEWIQVPGCIRPGAVEVVFRINTMGVIPLEDLDFYVQVRNMSAITVQGMFVRLRQVIAYDVTTHDPGSKTRHKETSAILGEVSKSKLRKHSTVEWMDPLMVPIVPPSGMEGCNCIDIRYFLDFELVVNKKLQMNLSREITVGTIALEDVDCKDSEQDADRLLEEDYITTMQLFRKSRRQTILSQTGSLHFIMHPAYILPQGETSGILPHVPDSFRI